MNRNKLMILAALTTVAFSAQARTPRDLDDLVNIRASSGERELEDRGYHHYKTSKIRDSSIGYWWNSRRGQCIAATTKDGRFSSILEQPESMCGKDGFTHGRDDDRGRRHGGRNDNLDDLEGMRASSGERELEDRGYQHRKTVKVKGHSIAYWWNPRKQRCVAATTKDGRYSSIMNQPESMCDDDRADSGGHRHGGNRDIDDLVGMRASSGERELKDRGYKFVNSSKGSDRIWANWWNRSDHKCITVVTMDGRYDSITDSLPADCDRR